MVKKVNIRDNWQWICFIAIAVLWFGTMLHGDLVATYDHGIAFLDCLFSGKPLDFYLCSGDNAIYGSTAIYFITLYIIFAIWNIPCWIAIHIFGIEMNSVACLLWARGLLVVCIVGSAIVLNKILKEIECKDSGFWIYIYCTSLFVMMPALAIGQYDIIGVFITLLGVLNYAKEEKISLKTLVIFSFAISLKFFALFIFIPAVLLKEKRIIYIIRNIVAGFGVTVITMAPYILNHSYMTISSEFNEGMFGRMLSVTLPSGLYSGISLFFVVFFAMCIIAYCLKVENEKEFINHLSWLAVMFYLGFFLFVDLAHPFWIIIMSPYVVLLIAKNEQILKLNLILEFAYELSIAFVHCSIFYWVYLNQDLVRFLVLKNVPINSNKLGIESFGEAPFGLSQFLPMAVAVFLVTGVAMLIINRKKIEKVGGINEKEKCMIKNVAYILRILILVGYFCLDMLITFWV